jgi:hypothetical protein
MKPSIEQLYKKPTFFIPLLEQAGMENAHAKVVSLMGYMLTYYSYHRYSQSMTRDRNRGLRRLDPEYKGRKAKPSKREVIRLKKSLRIHTANEVIYRTYAKRVEAHIMKKLAKWPEIEFTMSEFKAYKSDKDYNMRRAGRAKRLRKIL